MSQHTVFVFANLKPSQINYKIIPLSQSELIEKVIILRKDFIDLQNEKIICLSLPWLLKIRPFYWLFVAFYGILFIKKYKATIILNYNILPHAFNAYIASLFTGLPVVFSEINEDTIKYFKNKNLKYIIKRIIDNAKIITVPGINTGAFWEKVGYKNIVKLHSTIDVNFFKPSHESIKEYDFIYVGVFDNNKRPDLIINAFEKVLINRPLSKLCLIGYGESEDVVKIKISQCNVSGSISLIKSNNVLEFYQKSKIFVMASLSEGIPCAMMEAMATELIVLVPDVGDICEVVTNGVNGMIHDNTLEGIVRVMEKSMENYVNSIDIRKNARKTIMNEHSYSSATSKWNALLSTV